MRHNPLYASPVIAQLGDQVHERDEILDPERAAPGRQHHERVDVSSVGPAPRQRALHVAIEERHPILAPASGAPPRTGTRDPATDGTDASHRQFAAQPADQAQSTAKAKGSVEGAVRYLKTGFWPARRFSTLRELDHVYGDWRDQVAHRRRHATGQFIVADRLAEDRQALRALPPTAFDFSLNRTVRVPADGYLRYGGVLLSRAGRARASARRAARLPRPGVDLLARQRGRPLSAVLSARGVAARAEDATRAAPTEAAAGDHRARIEAPELADYAELCA